MIGLLARTLLLGALRARVFWLEMRLAMRGYA